MSLLLDEVRCPYCHRRDAVEDVSEVVRQARRMAFCGDCALVFPLNRPRFELPPRKDIDG